MGGELLGWVILFISSYCTLLRLLKLVVVVGRWRRWSAEKKTWAQRNWCKAEFRRLLRLISFLGQ